MTACAFAPLAASATERATRLGARIVRMGASLITGSRSGSTWRRRRGFEFQGDHLAAEICSAAPAYCGAVTQEQEIVSCGFPALGGDGLNPHDRGFRRG